MFGVTTSDDYRPVGWMGRYPVDVTTILVGAHVVALVGCCILSVAAHGFLSWLMFDSAMVLHGFAFHQLFTYAFVHAPSASSWWPIMFAVEMYMLFAFGRQVERFLGRRAFIWLYALLIFVPSIVLTAVGPWFRSGMVGSTSINFGVFVAFAVIYPNVEMLLRISAKWVAAALAGLSTLQLLTFQSWGDLAVLWASVATAYFFIRTRGVGPELVWWENVKSQLQPKPKFKVLPKARPVPPPPDSIAASVDPILDKIAKSGIASLTPAERQMLDRAREELLKSSE